MVNYNHIYYFYEVARFSSITKAAEHLRLSQPSLSIQIKTLEQQLGFKLIEKKGRNIVLTDWGQRLYAQTARLFQGTNELVARFKEKDNSKKLRIAVSSDVEPSLFLEMAFQTEKKKKFKFKNRTISSPVTTRWGRKYTISCRHFNYRSTSIKISRLVVI